MDDSFEDFGLTVNSSNNNNNNKVWVGAREKLMTSGSGVRRLLQVGLDQWLDDKEAKPFSNVARIIFIVPGNPGEIFFYKYFMERLHQELGLPVIGVSHSGLSRRCQRLTSGPLTVRKLVDDGIEFIEEYIPESVEIILIGHSIGSFIAKEIMQVSEKRERFVHGVLTCPALESLRRTPGGCVVRVLHYFPFLLYIWVSLLWLFPDRYNRMLFTTVLDLLFDHTECTVSAFMELIHVPSVRNAIILAEDEFNQVLCLKSLITISPTKLPLLGARSRQEIH